jgi:hypothetical protein
MKAILKKILLILGIFILVGIAALWYFSESLPKGDTSKNGDELATKMQTALNVKAWDTMKVVTWKSLMNIKYTWNKPANTAVIEWDNIVVKMVLNSVQGEVYKDGKLVEDKAAVDKAWASWCNDSFWMFAHYKVFDKGTQRSVVPMEGGKTGLLVSYESGGVTPGDKYLWILNEKYIPEGYKMWVKIVPVKGMYASWENWTTLKNGVMVAPKHKMKVMEFEFTDIAVLE